MILRKGLLTEIASEPTQVPYERVLWDIDDEGTEGDADAFNEEVPETFEPEAAMPEADDYTPEALDQYLTANIVLPHNDTMQKGYVRARKRDANGNPKGIANNNPLLDTRVYDVEFPDGKI